MERRQILLSFVEKCAIGAPKPGSEKSIGWESLIAILVYEGLRVLLPELREWTKLAMSGIVLKRQELRQRLERFAMEKELDFPAAQQAAQAVADNINEENVEKLIDALKGNEL